MPAAVAYLQSWSCSSLDSRLLFRGSGEVATATALTELTLPLHSSWPPTLECGCCCCFSCSSLFLLSLLVPPPAMSWPAAPWESTDLLYYIYCFQCTISLYLYLAMYSCSVHMYPMVYVYLYMCMLYPVYISIYLCKVCGILLLLLFLLLLLLSVSIHLLLVNFTWFGYGIFISIITPLGAGHFWLFFFLASFWNFYFARISWFWIYILILILQRHVLI